VKSRIRGSELRFIAGETRTINIKEGKILSTTEETNKKTTWEKKTLFFDTKKILKRPTLSLVLILLSYRLLSFLLLYSF